MINAQYPTLGANLPYTERALDPATWDVIMPVKFIYGFDAIVQRFRVRFGFWLGEWFLDTSQGTPYRERVFIKGVKLPTINALFRKMILNTPGIMSVSKCQVSFLSRTSRLAKLDFVALLSDGTVITAVNEPFRVIT